jgi:hypothetical protein
MYISYSLHKINDLSKLTFNPTDYSKFKFGIETIAQSFGNELAIHFINEYSNILLNQEELYIAPSPYLSIPTASNYLCKEFVKVLNRFLCENKKKAINEIKITRINTYTQDYGNLTFEERKSMIEKDTYYIDKEVIKDKFCIFIDDIKITGSHEFTIKNILQNLEINGSFYFVYFAELKNNEISPKIENFFNYYALKDLNDLINVINDKNFNFNTRVIKYLLCLQLKDFETIISKMNEIQKKTLLNLAISNNYHLISLYLNNFNHLKNIIYGN